jgi:hypothetical protein
VNTGIIAIDLQQAVNMSYMSSMEQLEVIPLETNDSCFIGKSHIMRMDSNHIFIVDDQTQEIFIFTASGKFISKISGVGQGPGEYLRIDDIRLHPVTNNIIILDGTQYKIVEYTKTGRFVSEKKFPIKMQVDKFSYTMDSQFIFSSGLLFSEDSLKYSIFILSENFECTSKLFPYKETTSFIISPRQVLQKVNGQLYYLPVYSQTLYSISDQESIAQYTYSFGKHDMNKKMLLDYPIDNPFKLLDNLERSKYIYFFNLNITTHQILADFIYKGIPYFHVYNLEDKSQKLFYDETMKECNATIIPLTIADDKFVSLILPDQIDALVKSNPMIHIDSLDEMDNPIVIKYKF